MFLIKYGNAPTLLLLQTYLPGCHTKHFMAVQTLFLMGTIFDMWQDSKRNYFAVDKG